MAYDYELSKRAIGFLVWFRNQYKVWTGDSYSAMARKYGQSNYGTCRNHILELEKLGYIRITNKGAHFQKFYLNLEKYNELVNPYVFRKYDTRTEGSNEPKN